MYKSKYLLIILVLSFFYFTSQTADAKSHTACSHDLPSIHTSNYITPQSIGSGKISFKKVSPTVAKGSASVATTAVANSIEIAITLQEAKGTSTTYTNSSQPPVIKKVYNKNSISKSFSFKITSRKKYRVKVVIKDVVKGKSTKTTKYKKMTF